MEHQAEEVVRVTVTAKHRKGRTVKGRDVFNGWHLENGQSRWMIMLQDVFQPFLIMTILQWRMYCIDNDGEGH
jgi:hypothetical protein